MSQKQKAKADANDLPDLQDPRSEPAFRKSWFPSQDGKRAPVRTDANRDDVIKLRFLICYYHLNRLFANLTRLRKKGVTPESERALMREIDQWLQRRDQVSEEARMLGIVAEPIREKGYTREVLFTCPRKAVAPEPRRTATIHMRIP
jgi:hypothetical protein